MQQGLCGLHSAGDYVMIRLPKNRGAYDCANVEIYQKPADAQAGNKLGQYCLTEAR